MITTGCYQVPLCNSYLYLPLSSSSAATLLSQTNLSTNFVDFTFNIYPKPSHFPPLHSHQLGHRYFLPRYYNSLLTGHPASTPAPLQYVLTVVGDENLQNNVSQMMSLLFSKPFMVPHFSQNKKTQKNSKQNKNKTKVLIMGSKVLHNLTSLLSPHP